jgi:hypothetical protein
MKRVPPGTQKNRYAVHTQNKGVNTMSIKHHFSKEQARQLCEEFGIDWHWSYSVDERNPASLEMEKTTGISRGKKRRAWGVPHRPPLVPSRAFKRKHPSGKTS